MSVGREEPGAVPLPPRLLRRTQRPRKDTHFSIAINPSFLPCPFSYPRHSTTRHSIPIPAPILRVPSHRRLRSPRAIPRRFLGSPLAGHPDPRQVRASISPSRIAISFRLRRWALVDRSGGGFWAGRRTAVALDFLVIAFLRLVLDRRTRARNFVLCL